MENKTKYWIVVASKDHVKRGVEGGFMQANHGKEAPLKRIKPGDWIVFYSSKLKMEENEKCQAFTAMGEATDDEIYQQQVSETFNPYRRKVRFSECDEVSILPLIPDLDFIENKKSWGYPFRFGFFEIKKKDFDLISREMIKNNC